MGFGIRQGFDLATQDVQGRTIFHHAAESKNKKLISELISREKILDIQDNEGETPLHLAAKGRDLALVKMLLKKGASTKIIDDSGNTALLLAAEAGNLEIVSALIEAKSPLNEKEKDDGRTALFLATKNEHKEIVQILLENGANPNILDINGKSAKDERPEYFCDQAILKLFEKSIKIKNDKVFSNLLLHHNHLEEELKNFSIENKDVRKRF